MGRHYFTGIHLENYFRTIPNRSLLDKQLKDTTHLANIASSINDWPTALPYFPNLQANDVEEIRHDCKSLAEQR